jgi:tetratricopeptide (TPR) repeat protein/tRNA A-37 threonylcarbamoyl transferase component Bud32
MTDSLALVGTTISHYRVVEKIGQGAMGVVYRAHDLRLERDVALKFLPHHALPDSAARKRFRNEALALARLNHPNICSVFDFDTADDTDFLVMEFVPGVSLHDRLHDGAPLLEEVIPFGLQLAAGLATAHEQGVLHRDLKPGNLRVTPEGRLKILDFGLAKLFHPEAGPDATISHADTSSISGTVPYMAPEQLRGEALDARSDVYSAGAVLFELATGRRPFPERQFAKLISDIMNTDAPRASRINLSVSAGLDSVIAKAMARQPEDRYQSVAALHQDLERISMSKSPLLGAPRRLLVAVASAALLCLLAAGVSFGWYFTRKHHPPPSPVAAESVGDAAVAYSGGAPRRSVAVLSIKNVSGRADAAWLSTALSEMLTTELAAGETLRTIPGETVSRAKVDLSLSDSDTFAQDTLRRINQAIGSDAVVSGSYVVVPGGSNQKIRVDLRVQDAHSGEIVASVSESGEQSELLDVVSRAGAKLRSSLGVADLPSEQLGQAQGALPASPEAARLYAQGLDKLRVYDSLAARDLLEKAAVADPRNSAVRTALATAWGQLGYDERARAESKKALDLSAGLSREARLAAEGRYQMATHNWPRVVEIFRSLFTVFPDNPDYGLQLASALSSAGDPEEAFAVLDKVRANIPSVKDDPRVDLAEANVADRSSDFKREDAAAMRAIERAKSRGERLTVARGLLLSGWALHNLGDAQKATEVSLEAKLAYEGVGDRVGLSRALHNLALIQESQGRLDDAEANFNQAIAIRRQIQDNQGLARALGDLAFVYERRGDLAKARKNYEASLAISQQIADYASVATAYGNLSNISSAQGKPDQAQKLLQHSLDIFRQIGNKSGVASCLANLGNLASDAGDIAGARKLYEESARTFDEIGRKAGTAQVRTLIAGTYFSQGDYSAARTEYEQSIAAAREVRDPLLLADAESGLSRVARLQGDWPAARAHAENALAAAKDGSDKRQLAIAHFDFAASLDGPGDLATSKKALEEGMRLAREVGDTEIISLGLYNTACYQSDQGELTAARQSFEQSLSLSQQRKASDDVAETQTALAGVFLDLNNPVRAEELARASALEMQKVKNAPFESQAQIVLARAALARKHLPDAQQAIARAAALSAPSASPDRRLVLAIFDARVRSAAGDATALHSLQAALDQLGPKATLESRLEARLALAEITKTASGSSAARPILDALGKEATEKGYTLYARKAAALGM